jgi:hypothetical protein
MPANYPTLSVSNLPVGMEEFVNLSTVYGCSSAD